jgi:hypothetical protein
VTARFILTALEGAFMISRARQNVAPVVEAGRLLAGYLRLAAAAKPAPRKPRKA